VTSNDDIAATGINGQGHPGVGTTTLDRSPIENDLGALSGIPAYNKIVRPETSS